MVLMSSEMVAPPLHCSAATTRRSCCPRAARGVLRLGGFLGLGRVLGGGHALGGLCATFGLPFLPLAGWSVFGSGVVAGVPGTGSPSPSMRAQIRRIAVLRSVN